MHDMMLTVAIAFLLLLAANPDDANGETALKDAQVLPFEKLWTEETQTFRQQHLASLLKKVQIDKDVVFAHTPEREIPEACLQG